MPTYLYWGEEDFSIDLAVKKLRGNILDPDWKVFNHKVFNNPAIKTILEAITTVPMGFGEVLVEIHNLNLFSRKTKSKDSDEDAEDTDKDKVEDRDLKELLELIPHLQDRVNLLFVVVFPRGSKKKIDKNLKTTKILEKHGIIQQFDSFKDWDSGKVIPWITDAAKELNVIMPRDVAVKLFETTGPELRKLNSEINKLATFVGPNKPIKKEHVELLCSGIDNVFVLLEKWVNGKTNDSLNELSKILDKDHPVKLIASLQTLLGQWLHVKLELKYGKTSGGLYKELGINQFVIKNAIEKTRSVPVERLSHLKEQLTIYENKIKTGQMNAELAMEILMTM